MEKIASYRLIRDALGFYSQVPIEEPLIAEDAIEEVVVEPPAKAKGRPKKRLNAEFEVDLP